MSLLDLFRKRREVTPSAEAMAALAAADNSHRRAQDDLARQVEQAGTAAEVRQALAGHNAANHYSEWLANLMMGRAS